MFVKYYNLARSNMFIAQTCPCARTNVHFIQYTIHSFAGLVFSIIDIPIGSKKTETGSSFNIILEPVISCFKAEGVSLPSLLDYQNFIQNETCLPRKITPSCEDPLKVMVF